MRKHFNDHFKTKKYDARGIPCPICLNLPLTNLNNMRNHFLGYHPQSMAKRYVRKKRQFQFSTIKLS